MVLAGVVVPSEVTMVTFLLNCIIYLDLRNCDLRKNLDLRKIVPPTKILKYSSHEIIPFLSRCSILLGFTFVEIKKNPLQKWF